LHISTTEHEVLVICSALGVAREGLIIMEEITQWFIIIFLKKHGHNCFFLPWVLRISDSQTAM
jgi:hypothetical protein